jgi:hypothetical protein
MKSLAASKANARVKRTVAAQSRRARHGRFAVALVLGAGIAIGMTHLKAQQAGQNTNVLPAYPIGNTFPPAPIANATQAEALKGDNYGQRQAEPVVAASSFNPDVLVAAYNDYRTVVFASDTGLGSAGYSWMGYSRSYDRGKHWYGAMVPGFPGGTSAADLSSPLHGLLQGSDPALTTTPGGHFYLGGLFFTPSGISNIAVMHLRHVPSLDGGDSIQPGKISIVDKGSQSDTGNFEDKPAIASDVARNTTNPSICGPVYMAYTIFVGGGGTQAFNSKIGFSRSKQGKCGDSWDNDVYVHKNYKQNQGTAMAVDPRNGKIYLIWRHVSVPGGDGFADSILMVTSTDFGASFSNPVPITGTDFAPLDHLSINSTTDPNNVSFRSNAFPAIAIDGFGNVYVAVQEKVAFGPPAPAGYNEPRITIRTLRGGSGAWTKSFLEANPVVGGQQMMPSLTASAGLVRALWYDFRQPESFPSDPAWGRPSTCDNAGNCYMTGLDRRMETRLAQSAVNINGTLAFAPSIPVTKYNTKLFSGLPAVNRPNLPMYVNGTTASPGDYITVMSGSPFVPNPPGSNPPFRWATETTDFAALPSLTVWADSRDVVFPIGNSGQPELSVSNITEWQHYAPPTTGQASCINPGSRNQNVYFSEVKAGVIAGSPATSRQLVDGTGAPFERAFPFYVQNATLQQRYFRISFLQDSTAVNGSFTQGTAKTASQPPPPVDVATTPISTVSKTIYAYCASCNSSNAFKPFSIKVDEIDVGGSVVTGGLKTLLRFNSDPTAPFVTNVALATQEIHDVTISAADWANADWANADWANADWANADWANADWANADWANADWANADWANADWANADWANADWANTSPVGDLVATAANVGNNASSYSVSVNLDSATAQALKQAGYLAGLFITRSYNKPGSFSGCAIDPIPLEHIISVIPVDLDNPQATVLDTAAFAASPALTTIAAGNSSGAAEIQPDKVFIVLRVFGQRPSGPTGPPATPLTTAQQTAISDNTSATVTPQAGPTQTGKTFATVTLSDLTQTYTGSPLTPTATTNPPGLPIIWTGAPKTNVGNYPVLATINDATYQGSASGTFRIIPAPSTTTVTCPASVTYNGSPQTPCSANVTGAGGLNQSLIVTYTNNTNAGVATASASYPGDGNHAGSSDTETFTIAQAPSTTTFGPAPTPTYPGPDFTVSADNNSGGAILYSKVSGPCTLVGNGTTGTFSPTGVGNCLVQADSAATQNYQASSAQQTVVITRGNILIYGPALATNVNVNEATLASAAGYNVVTKTAAEWATMSTNEFASYNAIVFSDPNCALSPSPTLDAAIANRTTWSPAVTGHKVVVGTDPVYHANVGTTAAQTLMINGISFAASGSTTGMYMSLSCYYVTAPPSTAVTVLDQFGSFQVEGWQSSQVTIDDPSHPVMAGLTDATLSNWVDSVHEWVSSFPASWQAVASETTSGAKPYIIAHPAPITLGVADQGNCYPFMCNDSGTASGESIHYQQVYAASAFSGPIDISSLTFFQVFAQQFGGTTAVLTGNYKVSLSTTTRSVSGLSTDLASNIGADNKVIFDGPLGGTSTAPSFTITASSPFVYNPSAGNNLLLDIVVTNQANVPNFSGNGYNDADGTATSTTRAYAFLGAGTGTVDAIALVTRFR